MTRNYLLSGFILLSIYGQAGIPSIVFEENKDQWPSQVKFQADIPGGKLFLEQSTFTYFYQEDIDMHRIDPSKELKVRSHCYKVHFEGSKPDAAIAGNSRYPWHRNYYRGNDPKHWAADVPVYGQVFYKELYDKIDMQVYHSENHLKYDLIVQPGGDPSKIRLRYEGTDGMYLENGNLVIKTSVYTLMEQKPYVYQVVNGLRKQIACSYILKDEQMSFSIGKYDSSLPLVIDPTLIASTYSGSPADNQGGASTYDALGNIYMSGTVWGTGYPTTAGAHDQTFNGGNFDISISKFNTNGSSILYSTYYGGIGDEQSNSLIVNSNNDLYILGRTNSSNFPTLGPIQAAGGLGYDVIVGKFNSTGGLLASTYLGGTADDGVNVNIGWDTYGTTKFSFFDDVRGDIALDKNGDVIITGSTKSTNFPTVTAQQATMAGVQDAFVAKMNSTLSSLLFSTYLGGTGTDAAFGLRIDQNNNVYVTGGTSSNNFPTTAGVLNTAYQGGLTDGFISVFSGSGILLRSTYLGTSAYDQSFFIDVDAGGDVYVFGQTQGTYPVTAGCYSTPNSGHFIHKLSANLSNTIYSTTIGTGPAVGTPAVNLSPTAFEIDSCGTIYFAGWGRSSVLSTFMPFPSTTVGLPVTANAQQSTTDGRDFYIAVLEPDAKGLLYGTFFGENSGANADHLDGGICRIDENGILYHAACASCGGTQGFPTAPQSYSSTNNSNHINPPFPSPPVTVFGCNEAVFKIDLSGKPSAVGGPTGPTSGCAPFVVSFNNSGSTASNFYWDFGDGGSSTLPNPTHTYSFAGTYTVTLFAIDSIGTCGYMDTTHTVITVMNCTGINEHTENGISIFPNPSSGLFTLTLPEQVTEIVVRDVMGNVVLQSPVSKSNQKSSFDLTTLARGVYLLEIKRDVHDAHLQRSVLKIVLE